MTLILDVIYFLGMVLAFPLLLIKSWRTGKYRSGWAGRFGRGEMVLPKRAVETKVLLIHCVSVGELLSVQTLIGKLLAADEHLNIVISTGTDTGTARAKALYPPTDDGRVHLVRYPLDFSFAVESLFDRVRPDAIVLVELETWPNFLSIARRRRIPVAIINGRISERSFPRYQWIRPVMAAMLKKVAWIGAQTQTIAQRFVALGAAAENVEVIPTLKYDNAPTGDKMAGSEALAAAMGLVGGEKLFVAGSTGPGEEEAVLEAYVALRRSFAEFTELRLAIVPRHPEVVAQVVAAIERRGLKAVKRTGRPDGNMGGTPMPLTANDVFVLDTMGELRKLYGLAFCVFVGRSLVKLGGSDMIEVAAMGKPCCFGPYTTNFAEVVELLVGEKTARVVWNWKEMAEVLVEWLEDPAGAKEMGRRAREVIAAQCGSTEKYVVRLLGMLRRVDATSN